MKEELAEFRVEKNPPPPEGAASGRGRPYGPVSDAIARLEKDENLFFPSDVQAVRRKIYFALYHYIATVRKRYPERVFRTRTTDDGVRVWRAK